MIQLTTLAHGPHSRIVEPRRAVARTAQEWRALWAAHAGPDGDPPAVDFGSHMVAAVFAGERPDAGSSVEVTGAEQEGEALRITWIERSAGAGMVAAQILTTPFHIVALTRFEGPVRWAGPDARSSPGNPLRVADSVVGGPAHSGPAQTARPLDPASSTGLDPRTASALAYLVGPLSGGLILLAESRNEDVRFHAWQSVIGLGGLWLAGMLCYVLAFAALFVTATGVSWMLRLSTVVWSVWVVVWVVCLWMALSGERWKLPLAGDYAERYAASGARGPASP